MRLCRCVVHKHDASVSYTSLLHRCVVQMHDASVSYTSLLHRCVVHKHDASVSYTSLLHRCVVHVPDASLCLATCAHACRISPRRTQRLTRRRAAPCAGPAPHVQAQRAAPQLRVHLPPARGEPRPARRRRHRAAAVRVAVAVAVHTAGGPRGAGRRDARRARVQRAQGALRCR
jgi:hypothetical protein